jgi:tetrahydromethanopterin S-methyltransferase subunit G
MADAVTREFLLEQFRENRRLHERTADRLDRIERRLDSVDDHVATLIRNDASREKEFTALERRVARIEERLNLRDADA